MADSVERRVEVQLMGWNLVAVGGTLVRSTIFVAVQGLFVGA